MHNWYVIKTKPKQEKTVVNRLSQAGYELFLPEIEGVNVRKPLFPSYLFIQANLRAATDHRFVRYTRGVSIVLGDENGPCPIAAEIIETLRDKTKDGCLIEQELLFKEGENVVVRRGILRDLMGMIECHLPDQKRVQVLFKWWNTSMRAKLKYMDLEKAA